MSDESLRKRGVATMTAAQKAAARAAGLRAYQKGKDMYDRGAAAQAVGKSAKAIKYAMDKAAKEFEILNPK